MSSPPSAGQPVGTCVIDSRTYQDVAALAIDYLDASCAGEGSLAHLVDPVWSGKVVGANAVQVFRREPSAFRVHADASSRHELTSVQVFYPDFAMARADARSIGRVIYLTLFRIQGAWRIATSVLTAAAAGTRYSRFSPETSAQPVLDAMAIYYRAVEHGDPDALAPLFHEDWEMKYPEDGALASEGPDRFLDRLRPGPLPGYYDDRQVTDLQILFDRIAIVRVDKPTTRSTTMFTLVKLNDRWLFLDKAWAEPPGE